MQSRFGRNLEHGEYKSGRTGQLILFAARGPWNDNTMKRGSREMSEHIAALDHPNPWAQISCLYGESLMPPSTFDTFVKHTNIRKQIGLEFLAVVILSTDIRMTIEQHLAQAYGEAGLAHAFYDSVEEAMEEIQSRRFEFDRPEATQFFAENVFT